MLDFIPLHPLPHHVEDRLQSILREIQIRVADLKGRKPRRVAGNYPVARVTLRIFSNSNFGYSVVSSERMLSKSGHRLPSEGEAICMWSGVLVEMVLSFMVLGLSSSPHFLVDAHLQLLSFLAKGLCVLITFVVGFVGLRIYDSRE